MKYYPDRWVILKITPNDTNKKPFHRVLAGWYGGFTQGEQWKINSGITKIEKLEDETYDVHGYSGSIYNLRASGEGMTIYMVNVIDQYLENQSLVKIEIVPFDPEIKGE